MSKTITYNVPGISCGHCVNTIQMEVADLDGVESVVASQEARTATITYGDPATEDKIIALMKEINYPPEGHDLLQVG
jgi:copper chaperone CopZ